MAKHTNLLPSTLAQDALGQDMEVLPAHVV
jgi:hypothetical protein